MKCARCQVPLEDGDTQCSVCGEIVAVQKDNDASAASGSSTGAGFSTASYTAYNADQSSIPRLEFDPFLKKISIWWMVACAALAGIFIAVAFAKYSIEAMYASFVAAGLIAVPLVFIIFSRTVEAAFSFRKELTIVVAVLAALAGVYFLSIGIKRSSIHVETQGMQEMVTNENFTRTLVTGIICLTVIFCLLPVARMIMKGTKFSTQLRSRQTDAQTDIQAKTADNQNTYELRKLELQHELELRKLDLEKERIRMESERLTLLADNRMQMLTDETTKSSTTPNTQPPPPPPPPAAPQS